MEKKQGLSCIYDRTLRWSIHRYIYIYIYICKSLGAWTGNTTHPLTLSFRTTYPARSCTPRHAAVLLSKSSIHSLPPPNPPHPPSVSSVATILSYPHFLIILLPAIGPADLELQFSPPGIPCRNRPGRVGSGRVLAIRYVMPNISFGWGGGALDACNR